MQRYDHDLKEPGSLREVEWGPFILWSDHQAELQRVQSDHEQAVAKAREALAVSIAAMEIVPTVEYAAGSYERIMGRKCEAALAVCREALAALNPTDSGK